MADFFSSSEVYESLVFVILGQFIGSEFPVCIPLRINTRHAEHGVGLFGCEPWHRSSIASFDGRMK